MVFISAGCSGSGASTVPPGPAARPGPRLPAAGGAGAAPSAGPAQAGTRRRGWHGARPARGTGMPCSRTAMVPSPLFCKRSYTLKTSSARRPRPRALCERVGKAARCASLARRPLGPRRVGVRECGSSYCDACRHGRSIRCARPSKAPALPEPAPFRVRGVKRRCLSTVCALSPFQRRSPCVQGVFRVERGSPG